MTKKIIIAFALLFTLLGFNSSAFAEGAKRKAPEVLKEVDAKIQEALASVATGNAQELTSKISEINELAGEASANYKFEFERDKVRQHLKAARLASKKSDLAGAEQELKAAKEGFAKLANFL